MESPLDSLLPLDSEEELWPPTGALELGFGLVCVNDLCNDSTLPPPIATIRDFFVSSGIFTPWSLSTHVSIA